MTYSLHLLSLICSLTTHIHTHLLAAMSAFGKGKAAKNVTAAPGFFSYRTLFFPPKMLQMLQVFLAPVKKNFAPLGQGRIFFCAPNGQKFVFLAPIRQGQKNRYRTLQVFFFLSLSLSRFVPSFSLSLSLTSLSLTHTHTLTLSHLSLSRARVLSVSHIYIHTQNRKHLGSHWQKSKLPRA